VTEAGDVGALKALVLAVLVWPAQPMVNSKHMNIIDPNFQLGLAFMGLLLGWHTRIQALRPR
jgi:hypothetical protein